MDLASGLDWLSRCNSFASLFIIEWWGKGIVYMDSLENGRALGKHFRVTVKR